MKYLSVIVPVFNAEATLEKCLLAIRGLDGFAECELIVANDGSTDSSMDIAKKYADKVVSSPENKGAAFIRNLGAKSASGEFLLFIDSDVVLSSPDILSYFKEDLLQSNICGVVGIYDEKVEFFDFSSAYKHLSICFGQRMSPSLSSIASSATLAISRNTFFEHAGFNEDFPGVMAEDIEFSLRFALKTGRLWRVDERIKGYHFKKYNLFSLLKTNYLRIKGIAKATQKKDYKINYLKSCPSSAFVPLMFAFFTAVLFFSVIFYFDFLWPALAALLLFFLFQLKLFRYFKEKRGFSFALAAIFFSLCEMLMTATFASYWQIIYKFKKP